MPHRKFHILLLDDDRTQRRILEMFFAQKQNVLLTALADGFEGQEFIWRVLRGESLRPDLIIIDLRMPRINGQQFLEWLRGLEKEALRCLPVVVLTTSSDELEAKELYRLYAAVYEVKPADPAASRQVLEAIYTLYVINSVKLPRC